MVVNRDLVGGLGTVALGAAYLYLALQLRHSALSDNVGAGGVPRVIAALMIAMGAILALRGLLAARTAPAGGAAAAARPDYRRELLRAAGLVAIGVGYLIVVPFVGYLPAITALIIAVAAYQGVRPSLRLLAIGIAGALLLWLFFGWLLGIPMPHGALADLLP
jgi:hypothetical protein